MIPSSNAFSTQQDVRNVSGIQFDDVNENGQRELGEAGIAGITIYADANNNGLLDDGEIFDVSAADGSYLLENVPTGTHWIRRIWPDEIQPTTFEWSEDYLVATTDIASSASPTGESLRLRYLDPNDGTIVNEIISEVPVIEPNNATSDGRFIYTIDNVRRVLIQMTPQGGLIREIPVPQDNDGYIPYSHGPAVIDGVLYLITGAELTIREVDPETGEVSSGRQTTIAPHLVSLSSIPVSYRIVESVDGKSIWVVSAHDDRVLVLNPVTAQIESVFDFRDLGRWDGSAASLSSNLYVSSSGTSYNIRVYDENLTPGNILPDAESKGLSAGTFTEYGTEISGSADVSLDHPYVYFAEITGTIGNDTNGDGIIDGGEMPVEGVTAYIDANGNDWPDPDERSSVSNSDGAFTLSGLLPGSYTVNTLPPPGYRASDAYVGTGRLFGVSVASDSDSPTGYFADLWEINPTMGGWISWIRTEVPLSSIDISLAFDGDRVLLTDDSHDRFYALTVDGQLIDSRPLGTPFINAASGQTNYLPVTEYGTAYLGGSIFSVRKGVRESLSLVEYDPQTNEYIREIPLTYDFGLAELPGDYTPSPPNPVISLSSSVDGEKLVLATEDGYEYIIDPKTAKVSVPEPRVPQWTLDNFASAVLNSERFVSHGYSGIEVVDSDNQPIRTLTGVTTQWGLAAGVHRVAGQAVSIVSGETGSVDLGLLSTSISVSGSIIEDTNGNQMNDSGEPSLPETTVFLDLNQNAVLDSGEPRQLTDVNGGYEFRNIPPGLYDVRVVPPAESIVQAWGQSTVEAFAVMAPVFGETDPVIQQFDPLTGEILNEFPLQFELNQDFGLAADHQYLYLNQFDSDLIHVLSKADGAVVESFPGLRGNGLAVIGDRLFIVNSGSDLIHVFDLARREFRETWDLDVINGQPASTYDLQGALGAGPDGQHLIVGITGGDALILNPQNGIILRRWEDVSLNTASDGADGEFLEPDFYSNSNDLITYAVRDHLGLKVRSVLAHGVGAVFAMAAVEKTSDLHRIRVFENEVVPHVDFGVVPDAQTISGVQYLDTNLSGSHDVGEPVIPGITVYADVNANGVLDSGEPSAVSDTNGFYRLTDVPFGSLVLNTVPTPGYQQVEVTNQSEMLVGATRISSSESPTGYYAQLRRFRPDGTFHSRIPTTVPVGSVHELTNWKDQFLIVDNVRGSLMQIAKDGSLIADIPMPSGADDNPLNGNGLVVIDETVYLIASEPNQVIRFDPIRGEFFDSVPISAYADPEMIGVYQTPHLAAAATESIDGKSIVLFSRSSDRVFYLNPIDGRLTSVFTVPETSQYVWSAATFDDKYFINGSIVGLVIMDESFQPISFAAKPYTNGMTTIASPFDGVALMSLPGESIQRDIAHRSTRSKITGVISRDANLNGMVDPGEQAADVVVYLDINRNGIRDVGEIWTQTDVSGAYEFDHLLPGSVWVSVDDDDRATVIQDQVRLYAYDRTDDVPTLRRHDSLTGLELSSFTLPGLATSDAGLAVSERGLFYASSDGVWSLDPKEGHVLTYYDLPSGNHSGLATIDDHLFAFDADSGTLTRIDLERQLVERKLDINAINGTTWVFGANLSPWSDGVRLAAITQSRDVLVINPDTGVIEMSFRGSFYAPSRAFAMGEFYGPYGDTIQAQSQFQDRIRTLPVGYVAHALAATSQGADSIGLWVAPDQNTSGQDFLLLPAPEPTSSSITGRAWRDDDSDGFDDIGEPGLAGRTIFIDLNLNGALDSGEPTQTTMSDDPTTAIDETGLFQFLELAPGQAITAGTYRVSQVLPDHWSSTTTDNAISVDVADHSVVVTSGLGSNPPDAPTDILPSTQEINENTSTSLADTLFAFLSAIDEDVDDEHTFELVSGEGDEDNARFVVNEDQLLIRQGEVLDYESQANYSVRIRVTDSAGLVFERSFVLEVNNLVEVTKQDIEIGNGSNQRSRVQSLSIEFDTQVSIDSDAFAVIKRGSSGGSVDVDYTTQLDGEGKTVATLTFSGSFVQHGSLTDGDYQLTIDGSKISSIEGHGFDANADGVTGDSFQFGEQSSDNFFRLFGDVSGDRYVGIPDYVAFRSVLGGSTSNDPLAWAFDWDDDGVVGTLDLQAFRERFGKQLRF
ncbi:MAG: SdrD B-like domain-containing protein [Planctomycetota bacterium]